MQYKNVKELITMHFGSIVKCHQRNPHWAEQSIRTRISVNPKVEQLADGNYIIMNGYTKRINDVNGGDYQTLSELVKAEFKNKTELFLASNPHWTQAALRTRIHHGREVKKLADGSYIAISDMNVIVKV